MKIIIYIFDFLRGQAINFIYFLFLLFLLLFFAGKVSSKTIIEMLIHTVCVESVMPSGEKTQAI